MWSHWMSYQNRYFWEMDHPLPFDECAYQRCHHKIYFGDKAWQYDDQWYCSASCLAKEVGGVRKYIKVPER
ncbi:hypothetical protein [Brevibacillus migulae]|uniref:hypothetical protein n=1 Tax=Brevibacillus migulae TaxID=1644114 RepID=UPI00106DE672|nr:hypothetical protein [Brevibacillus migulae]